MAGRWEKWEGGRKWVGADGKVAAFYIRRRVGGVLREVRTPASSEGAAVAHLKRFEADPLAYDPAGTLQPDAVRLDADLVAEFLAFSEAEGNSNGWRRKQKNLLAWWGDRLAGLDMRKVSLRDHILPALKRKDATAKHHRIAVLKGLYSWLRAEAHRISTAEDPVFGQLKVPQAKVAQLTKSKVVPRENVLAVIEQLRAEELRRREERAKRLRKRGGKPSGKVTRDTAWAEALTLQAGTGWHTTEVQRFAAGGAVEALPKHASKGEVGGVVVCPMRKSGEPQRTRVSPVVLEAAKALLAHGPISVEWFDRRVKEACVALELPEFTPAQLRHTNSSYAMDVGADPAMISAFLGHRSPRTTRKFYATHATVAKVPTLL